MSNKKTTVIPAYPDVFLLRSTPKALFCQSIQQRLHPNAVAEREFHEGILRGNVIISQAHTHMIADVYSCPTRKDGTKLIFHMTPNGKRMIITRANSCSHEERAFLSLPEIVVSIRLHIRKKMYHKW